MLPSPRPEQISASLYPLTVWLIARRSLCGPTASSKGRQIGHLQHPKSDLPLNPRPYRIFSHPVVTSWNCFPHLGLFFLTEMPGFLAVPGKVIRNLTLPLPANCIKNPGSVLISTANCKDAAGLRFGRNGLSAPMPRRHFCARRGPDRGGGDCAHDPRKPLKSKGIPTHFRQAPAAIWSGCKKRNARAAAGLPMAEMPPIAGPDRDGTTGR